MYLKQAQIIAVAALIEIWIAAHLIANEIVTRQAGGWLVVAMVVITVPAAFIDWLGVWDDVFKYPAKRRRRAQLVNAVIQYPGTRATSLSSGEIMLTDRATGSTVRVIHPERGSNE